MFDFAVFLYKVVALIPAGVTLLACFGWVAASYMIIDRIDMSVSESMSWIVDQFNSAHLFTSAVGPNSSFLQRLLDVCAIRDALEVLVYFAGYLATIAETVVAVMSLLTGGIVAVWIYRKTKFACNMLTASGAVE